MRALDSDGVCVKLKTCTGGKELTCKQHVSKRAGDCQEPRQSLEVGL